MQQKYNEDETEFEMKGFIFEFIDNLDCFKCCFRRYPHEKNDFRCMPRRRKDGKDGGFKLKTTTK